ncbi:MAG: restriction endonuclease subunit S [SAR324 cluster bacterium]|nr:restriction endonuclease subunit S [SAR324 cluster bacterium]
MNSLLKQIGIANDSFVLLTVGELIKQKIIEKPLDGNHGEIHPKGGDFVETGVPFIMASDIKEGHIDYGRCKYITSMQADGLRKGFAKNGDVLLTHKATIGRTALVEYSDHPYVMLTPQVTYYRITNSKKLNNLYLKYYFDSELFQKTINLWAGSGATRAYIGITAQHALPIILPPIKTQRKIAAILSAYDDMIENSERQVLIFETMAEEIYREWFVRFRFPGYKDAEFEKGMPVHWDREKLDDLCSVIKRGVSPSYSDSSPNLVINQKCIRKGRIDLSLARPHDTKIPEEKNIEFADALINSTGVGTLGRVSIVEFSKSNLTVDSHVTICRANQEKINPIYLAVTITNLQVYFELMAAGSTGQVELNRSLIAGIKILVPPASIQVKFSELLQDIWRKKQNLLKSIKILNETKNILLPRLISGKLSLEDLDIQFPPSMVEAETA